eukprot:COSAG01_NODE_57771_length_310_cov_0.734597_1_plen_22_part_10
MRREQVLQKRAHLRLQRDATSD